MWWGNKNYYFIILVLMLVAIIGVVSCNASITPSFNAMNQANMSMTDSSGNLALDDFLFLADTTSVPAGDEVLVRNWTATWPGYSKTILNETNPVFGPVNQVGSVFVNLTITDKKGYEYPAYINIYHVIDGTDWINADYSYKAQYDNRTTGHSSGTIQFTDISVTKLFPETKITDWWWKYSNKTGAISGNYSGVNSFILPMNSWLDTYTLNLTVKNNQGNLESVIRNIAVPPDDIHPVANFTVTPVAGFAPLNISIIDQSESLANDTLTDIPLNYEYVIGNSTSPNVFGTVFKTKNLNVQLKYPGIYNVTQKVTNSFSVFDQQKIEGIEVYSVLPPEVDFIAVPQSGTKPLVVQFIDLSTGNPTSWNWNFGDGSEADLQNPTHKYTLAGSYTVSLQAKNDLYNGSISKSGYITVS